MPSLQLRAEPPLQVLDQVLGTALPKEGHSWRTGSNKHQHGVKKTKTGFKCAGNKQKEIIHPWRKCFKVPWGDMWSAFKEEPSEGNGVGLTAWRYPPAASWGCFQEQVRQMNTGNYLKLILMCTGDGSDRVSSVSLELVFDCCIYLRSDQNQNFCISHPFPKRLTPCGKASFQALQKTIPTLP